MSFRALVVDRRDVDSEPATALRTLPDDFLDENSPADADVTIDVQYSSINFKDGLAITGRPGVIRSYPLIPGIDLVGTVTETTTDWFSIGDTVVLNGDGLGETRNGGLAQRARVRRDALVSLPTGITPVRAAAIGTAGFTAMLAVLELERQEITPSHGEILVTGAAGGVGSIAIALLAGRGYSVTAATGRATAQGDYLRRLGASTIIDRAELAEHGKPLQTQRWAGAIDSVGSHTLANILAQTNYGGTVVSCGLAQGGDLPTTVMPFILRQVSLVGANSVEAPLELREQAWAALASELDPALLDALTTVVPLTDALDVSQRILAGAVRGRVVVDVRA
jgi:acrylyl-CoA reductase (NADPH)